MRLIDADEAIKNQWYGNSESIILRQYAVEVIKNAPTVDAVPVVRCKDCKYGRKDGNFDFVCGKIWRIGRINADDFCSYGERKENGTID